MEMIRQAVGRGHNVTALVRAPEPLKAIGSRVAVIHGDLLDCSTLKTALEDQDAVLSSFGPRVPVSKADADLLQRFAVVLTSAMQLARIRRAVIVSTAFLFEDSVLPPAHLIGRMFFRDLVADADRMEETIRKSDLDWTLVRPPQLTNKPVTGRYRVQAGHLPRFGFKISRADVADFMIKAVEEHAHVREVVGISN
jgi:putative NADH-flavin reductase